MVDGSIKRAVVLGASGGIGEAVAWQLRQLDDYEECTGARAGPFDFHFDLTNEVSIADAATMSDAFTIHAIGPALVAEHFLPLLRKDDGVVFAALAASAGSISDNGLGGWHSYRASKAALDMPMKNLALELSLRNRQSIDASLHPGTVDTSLSEPFQRNVAAVKLFTPAYCAAALLNVVDRLTLDDSGGLFALDGTRIPF